MYDYWISEIRLILREYIVPYLRRGITSERAYDILVALYDLQSIIEVMIETNDFKD